MALLLAREAAMGLFRPLLGDHDLTEQQWRVLRALGASDRNELEVGEVAEHTNLLAPSVTRILANLERRSLISRRRVDSDQRRAAISLTATGQALVDQVSPHSEAIYNRIEIDFGPDRLARLMSDLADLQSTTVAIAAAASPT